MLWNKAFPDSGGESQIVVLATEYRSRKLSFGFCCSVMLTGDEEVGLIRGRGKGVLPPGAEFSQRVGVF